MNARYRGPLLTADTLAAMKQARDAGATHWSGSLDLGRSTPWAKLPGRLTSAAP